MSTIWSWDFASQHVTLETLFHFTDKFCFFVGSGISLDPPSCLPTGYQITRALLERMIPEEERTTILALMNPERDDMQNPGDFLRFEQLMDYIQRGLDPSLRVLDFYAACITPNFNHMFLAQMLLQDHQVFTTNFDSLIEYALLELGISRKQIFPVIYPQDWRARRRRKQYRIFKLHGSLVDLHRQKDCRESLQATLAQISQGKAELLQLESWKQQILRSLFQNHDVIVMGYSGLDDFDVLPTLWTISSPKRIFWITHENIPLDEAQIEIIQTKPVASSSNPDRVGQNLLLFAKYQTRQPTQLFRITVNTKELLKWVWHRYIPHHVPIIDSNPCPEEERPLLKHLKVSEPIQWLLTGNIFEDRNLPTQSLKAYQASLTLAQKKKDKRLQATCLNNIGLHLYNQGQFDEALTHYQQALAIDEQLDDLEAKATSLNNIAGVLEAQGRIDEALKHYQQALIINEEVADLEGKATNLMNIGSLLYRQGRLKEALNHYQQTLTIHEQLGDLYGKARSLNNMGVLLKTHGKFREALAHYQQALSINEQLGDLKNKAVNLNNIGELFEPQGHLKEALTQYQQALSIFEQFEDVQRVITLSNIGRVLEAQGYPEKALEHYQQALAIIEQKKELHSKPRVLNEVGKFYYNQNRLDEAMDYFQQALTTAEQTTDLRAKAKSWNNMGIILQDQGHPDKALEYYRQALVTHEKTGDLEGKALNLNNIGTILLNQGRLEESLKYYQQTLSIFDELGDLRKKSITLENIGQVLTFQGKTTDALEQYQRALKIAKQLKTSDLAKEIQENIEKLRRRQ
ncbi:MAG: tetratricopeptide repeat protein [Candidatus Hodarchaeota archaeon]